jgi:hypothetical protein
MPPHHHDGGDPCHSFHLGFNSKRVPKQLGTHQPSYHQLHWQHTRVNHSPFPLRAHVNNTKPHTITPMTHERPLCQPRSFNQSIVNAVHWLGFVHSRVNRQWGDYVSGSSKGKGCCALFQRCFGGSSVLFLANFATAC